MSKSNLTPAEALQREAEFLGIEYNKTDPSPVLRTLILDYRVKHPGVPTIDETVITEEEVEALRNNAPAPEVKKEPEMNKASVEEIEESAKDKLIAELALVIEETRKEMAELKNARPVQQQQQPLEINLADHKEKKFGDEKSDIDVNDFEEEAAIFVMYGKGGPISTYFKNNKEMLAPFNVPLIFKIASSQKRMHGDSVKLVWCSTYVTNSKKEKEWLRGHPGYDKHIFENVKKAMNVDPRVSQKMKSIVMQIERMSASSLFAKANSLGIDINSGDHKEISSQVAAIEVSSLIENEKRYDQNSQNNLIEEAVLQNS